jgi:hypothetical protein
MKKISKVIVYYEDGTYEEIKGSVSDLSNTQNKKNVTPNPVTPDFRPEIYKIREWNNTNPLIATSHGSWTYNSTSNFANDNKYSITPTGNVNVDLSK